MLTACPECQRQVSTLAPSCPNCGAPIAQQLGKPVTIERTSKSVKRGMLISALVFWFGLIFLFNSLGSGNQPDIALATWMVLGGGIGWFAFKANRWWTNG